MTTDERFDETISGWLELTAPGRLPDRVFEATFERTRRSRQQIGWRGILGRAGVTRPILTLGGAAVIVLAMAAVVGLYDDQPAIGGPSPSSEVRSTFAGTWYSTSDADGGTQTMTVQILAEGAVEIVVTDDIASVCSGGPSTMTGIGRIESPTRLVIPAPVYTCDDGSEPQALSGPSLQEQLRDLTYVRDPERDTLNVGPGSVWTREAAPAGSPAPTTPGTSPSASPAQVVDFPDFTSTFVSPINGYVFKYIDRGGFVPATERWDPDNQPPINDLYASGAPYQDQFDVVETGSGAAFLSASTEIPEGVSTDAWVDAAVAKYLPNGCSVPRSEQAEIVIDGQPGTILEACPDNVVATVVVDGRLYLFILAHSRPDARAVFDAFAATIRLTPETPYYFANVTRPFVSPTNGYAFKYVDRGALVPATEHWDPATQPASGRDKLSRDQFDEVETGFGAQFFSASTEIPDGASIDDWVDASVVKSLSGDCHTPRSQQAEITIDGQSGRISECVDEVVATVVVDRRLYLFILYHDRTDARAFFDAFAATIELTPETAAAPGSVSGVGASSPTEVP